MQSTVTRIRLDKLLEEKGVTLYRLAKDTGINHTLLHRYQHNTAKRITIEHIDKICDVLDCEPGELFERLPVKKSSAKKRSK